MVWTVGEMLDQPFVGGFVAGRGGAASRGRYMGVYQLAFAITLVVAPVLGRRSTITSGRAPFGSAAASSGSSSPSP